MEATPKPRRTRRQPSSWNDYLDTCRSNAAEIEAGTRVITDFDTGASKPVR